MRSGQKIISNTFLYCITLLHLTYKIEKHGNFCFNIKRTVADTQAAEK